MRKLARKTLLEVKIATAELLSFVRVKKSRKICSEHLTLENEVTALLKCGGQLPSATVPHPRRTDLSLFMLFIHAVARLRHCTTRQKVAG